MTDRKESLIDYYTLRHLKSVEAALNAERQEVFSVLITFVVFAAVFMFMAFTCQYWLCILPGVLLLIMSIYYKHELRRILNEQKSINEKISKIIDKM